MPFVEYSSSSGERVRAQEQVLQAHEFGVSMMERATKNRAMLQDIEQRKTRFVQETLLNDQQIQQNRLRLAQMEGEQAVNSARNRTAVAELDAKHIGLVSNENRLAEAGSVLPQFLKRMEEETDPYMLDQIASEFLDKYGRLAENPNFADRFAPIAGEVTAVLKSRKTAFMTRVRSATEALLPHIDPTKPESLARIRNSPFFNVARLDPNFAKAFDDAQKTVTEHLNKVAEQDAKVAGEVKVNTAKADDEIRVKKETVKTDRERAPQYLVEKSIKIAQSENDLADLEQQFSTMTTGPILGFFRGLNPYDTDARALTAKLKATVPNLARGVFGEVGVLTDADIKNYMATLPNLRSPQERAAKLVELLRKVLDRQRTSVKSVIEGQGYRSEGLPTGEPARKPDTQVSSGSDLQARIEEAKRRGLLR